MCLALAVITPKYTLVVERKTKIAKALMKLSRKLHDIFRKVKGKQELLKKYLPYF